MGILKFLSPELWSLLTDFAKVIPLIQPTSQSDCCESDFLYTSLIALEIDEMEM